MGKNTVCNVAGFPAAAALSIFCGNGASLYFAFKSTGYGENKAASRS